MRNSALKAWTLGLLSACSNGAGKPSEGGALDASAAQVDAGGASSVASDAGTEDAATTDVISDYRSGQRLRAELRSTDDGTRSFLGWRDSARDEACDFETGSDGVLRCLPFGETSEAVFEDDACTHPVLQRPTESCVESARYVRSFVGDGCTMRTELRPILDARPSITMVYRKAGNDCVGSAVSNDVKIWALGEPLDPSAFVKAELVTQDTGERLKARVRVAEDGSAERIGWYDSQLETDCDAQIMSADGSLRCVPVAYAYDSGAWFADKTCTARAAITFGNDCPGQKPPSFAQRFEDDHCVQRVRLFALGAEVPVAEASTDASNCRPASEILSHPGPTPHLFALGEEVMPSALASFTLEHVGTARLQSVVQRAEGGATRVLAARYFDRSLTSECSFENAVDASLRCFPVAYQDNFYTDQDCKQPVAGTTATASCEPEYGYAAKLEPVNKCSFQKRMFRAGDKLEPTDLWGDFTGSCLPVGTSANRFVAYGEELSPSEFQRGDTVVE